VSEFDQLYREVILDHYKNPRGHGVIEAPDAAAEGQNPLCGDEVSIFVSLGEDGETIEDVKFSGRGCAISQAATSMLTEMVKGRSATDVATLPCSRSRCTARRARRSPTSGPGSRTSSRSRR
jgi:nitrogen fixation NifU-like protein